MDDKKKNYSIKINLKRKGKKIFFFDKIKQLEIELV